MASEAKGDDAAPAEGGQGTEAPGACAAGQGPDAGSDAGKAAIIMPTCTPEEAGTKTRVAKSNCASQETLDTYREMWEETGITSMEMLARRWDEGFKDQVRRVRLQGLRYPPNPPRLVRLCASLFRDSLVPFLSPLRFPLQQLGLGLQFFTDGWFPFPIEADDDTPNFKEIRASDAFRGWSGEKVVTLLEAVSRNPREWRMWWKTEEAIMIISAGRGRTSRRHLFVGMSIGRAFKVFTKMLQEKAWRVDDIHGTRIEIVDTL